MNKNLEQITNLGQSIWYDNLSRDVLKSGELKSIIDSGVRGLTSNPTIFKKAIADSSDYDSDIKELSKSISDPEKITESLMIADVGAAADLLRPLYDSSDKSDGYASIELSPYLANDTEKSIAQGKDIWSQLNRPNIMIKVPATDAGIPVITALLAEGINVNVTLIFSQTVYERVIEAYLAGLEARASAGGDISGIASVASFFVSRVDTIVLKSANHLAKLGAISEDGVSAFNGTVGIANSKAAYQSFLTFFNSKRFKNLEGKGAKVQRPLWASTGTKDPSFDERLYVYSLVGKDTVNTVPPQTLKAIQEKDYSYTDQITQGGDAVCALLGKVKSSGMPLEALLYTLQVEGVASFADSFTELIEAVKKKKEELRG